MRGLLFLVTVFITSPAFAILPGATLTCASTACPEGVGLLAIENENGKSEVCTATLIAPDLAMTNTHCVPKDLRRAGALCQDRMRVHFVPLADHETEMECLEVISVTEVEKGRERPDLAFLKLRGESSRAPLTLERSGFGAEQMFTLWKVDPDFSGHEIQGTLSNLKCRAIHGTDVTGSYNPLFPLMVLTDCNVVNGNSGGPLVNEGGHVPGLIQGFLRPESARQTARQKNFYLVDGGIAPINLATNLACFEAPILGAPDSRACAETAREIQAGHALPASPSRELLQENFLATVFSGDPRWMNYEWDFEVLPERRLDSWGGEHDLEFIRGIPLCRRGAPPLEVPPRPSFLILYGLNKYLKPGLRLASDMVPQTCVACLEPLPACEAR